jgi:Sec-independent protein translocase protein TatA
MYQEDLKRLLERLREEVGDAGTLTHESRQLMRELADEIDTALQQSGERHGIHHVEHNRRLANLVAQFEADHPGLAATMREVMHTLGQVGL